MNLHNIYPFFFILWRQTKKSQPFTHHTCSVQMIGSSSGSGSLNDICRRLWLWLWLYVFYLNFLSTSLTFDVDSLKVFRWIYFEDFRPTYGTMIPLFHIFASYSMITAISFVSQLSYQLAPAPLSHHGDLGKPDITGIRVRAVSIFSCQGTVYVLATTMHFFLVQFRIEV